MFRANMLSKLLSNSIRAVRAEKIVCRNLYAASALGLEGFLGARERTKMQISNVESFKAKMEEFVKDESSKNLVFTEDLKNMLHIADKPDVDLLSRMIKKFCSQSSEARFGNYVFGPPIMRLLYHLNDPETAIKLFNDSSLGGFFDQLVTYQLVLDLLYNNKMYQKVLDTYDVAKARQVQGGRYPKNAVVIVLGACYKLDTPASYEYATHLWKDLNEAGHIPMRRAATFFATLALNQGHPHVAMEVLSNVRRANYATIKIIKSLVLANLKRYDDTLIILKSVLEVDNPMAPKQTFPKSVVELLKKEFEGNTNKDLQSDFEKVTGFMAKHDHLTENHLDDILCSEIQDTFQMNDDRFRRDDRFSDRRNDNYRRNNYDDRRGQNYDDRYRRQDNDRGFQRRDNYPSNQRPGLHELN